jgi:hypothetical protein
LNMVVNTVVSNQNVRPCVTQIVCLFASNLKVPRPLEDSFIVNMIVNMVLIMVVNTVGSKQNVRACATRSQGSIHSFNHS